MTQGIEFAFTQRAVVKVRSRVHNFFSGHSNPYVASGAIQTPSLAAARNLW